MSSKYHYLFYVPVYANDWDTVPNYPERWDVIGNVAPHLSTEKEPRWGTVFIDHRPGERRIEEIKRFEYKADIIVVHDTEQSEYKYETVFKNFKYRYDYKRYTPYTTLVSNFIDVTKWI